MLSTIHTKPKKLDATADGRTDVSAGDKCGPTLDSTVCIILITKNIGTVQPKLYTTQSCNSPDLNVCLTITISAINS